MTETEKTEAVHRGIRREFLRRGGTEEQWARVAANPLKFNRAWRRVLGLEDGTTPPPELYRSIDPSTGEVLA